jgi:hypothetical protein
VYWCAHTRANIENVALQQHRKKDKFRRKRFAKENRENVPCGSGVALELKGNSYSRFACQSLPVQFNTKCWLADYAGLSTNLKAVNESWPWPNNAVCLY